MQCGKCEIRGKKLSIANSKKKKGDNSDELNFYKNENENLKEQIEDMKVTFSLKRIYCYYFRLHTLHL